MAIRTPQRGFRWFVAGPLGLLLAIAMGRAGAQQVATGASSSDSGALTEVVVTARRVLENLQTVPIATVNFSSEQLTQMNLTQSSDLGRFLPSTFIEAPAGGNATSAKVTIRGQVQADNLITLDPSVGWYLDDVYLARAYATNVALFDVQRVETLEGPQGTLYGRNTTGGAIKIVTVQADPSAGYTGFGTIGYGNHNEQMIGGAVNLPLVADKFALRLSAQDDDQHSGWGRINFSNLVPLVNPTGPTSGSEEAGRHDNWMARINGTWNASDRLTLWFGYEHDRMDLTYVDYNLFGDKYVGIVAPTPLGPFPVQAGMPGCCARSSTNYYTATLAGGLPRSTADANTAHITGEYKINDDMTSRLVLGWRQLNSRYNSDIDGTNVPLATFYSPETQDDTQWSAEWQLAVNRLLDGKLDLLGGLFFFQEKGADFTNSDGLGALSTTLGPLAEPLYGLADKNKSRSPFINGTYHVTDTINFTAGLRYTWDTKPLYDVQTFDTLLTSPPTVLPFPAGCRFATATPPPGYNPATCSFNVSDSFDYLSWQVGLDWRVTPNVMVYVKGSDASRSGGQNERGETASGATPFNPEKATVVEFGVKSQFWDDRIRLNGDFYHTYYTNVQQVELLEGNGGLTTSVYNAGKAGINGLEIQLTARLTDQLTFMENGSYFDGAFTSHDVNFGTFTGTPTFNSAPRWQSATELQFRQPVPFGAWTLAANYSYRTSYYANGFSLEQIHSLPSIDTTVPGLGLLGARMTFDLARWDTEIALWGKNITNKQYYESPLSVVTGVNMLITTGDPRTYGITLTKKF